MNDEFRMLNADVGVARRRVSRCPTPLRPLMNVDRVWFYAALPWKLDIPCWLLDILPEVRGSITNV